MSSINPNGECIGELVINDVSMHTPAWTILDLIDLWLPPAMRGTNVIIPHASGRRAYPMRFDETDYSLPMFITGEVDHLGVPDPDGFLVGLWKNLEYLQTNVVGPLDGVTSTYPATLTMPDATVLVADVQVMGIEVGDHWAELARAVLHVRIPTGRFV